MIIRCLYLSQIAALLAFAMVVGSVAAAENISPLGKSPDWSALEKFQETITHDDFAQALQSVYCTRGVGDHLIKTDAEAAHILVEKDAQKWFTLRFATTPEAGKAAPHSWRSAAELAAPRDRRRVLEGLKIAIDPGHIGGTWAHMEERWFQVGDSKPVQEGDMTLLVATILKPQLEALGAKVSLVRDNLEPVTSKRPDDLKEVSRELLHRGGNANPREDFAGPDDPEKEQTVRWQSEILFYRNSEIRRRAELVNAEIHPDVVLCLHFNAEAWNDPKQPTLIDRNHLHLLVNGSYLPPELEFDDVRFEMIHRLLSRTHEEEMAMAEKLAPAMAAHTQLPPYEYTTENVTKTGTTGYVYLRNLVATRLYGSPVLYFEPYVMNSHEFFDRVQEGDYAGLRNVNAVGRQSVFRDYADGVVDGLIQYYAATRK